MTSETLSLMDRIKAQKQGNEKDIPRIKFPTGKNLVRILPTWRDDPEEAFWHDYGKHWVKKDGQLVASYLCVDKTYDKPCEICNLIKMKESALIAEHGFWKKRDSGITPPPEAAAINEATAKKRKLLNVLHLNGPTPDTPQLYDIADWFFQTEIIPMMDDYGNITDLEKGTDIIIEKTGSGATGTKYSFRVAPPKEQSGAVDPAIMENVFNLDEVIQAEAVTGYEKAIAAIPSAIGLARHEMPVLEHEVAALPSGAGSFAVTADDADFEEDDSPLEPDTSAAMTEEDMEAVADDLDELDELAEL